MNILYLGPYKQNDGWGNAAKGMLEALDRTGHTVASRHLPLSKKQLGTPDFYTERLVFDKLDVVIQNCLPHQMCKIYGAKNISYGFFETINPSPRWMLSLKEMDLVLVNTEVESKILLSRTDKKPSLSLPKEKVVKIPMVISPYLNGRYRKGDFASLGDEFVFYFVGEFTDRKNLRALLLAYLGEFNCFDKVRLIIKTSVPRGILEKYIKDLLGSMRVYDNQSLYPTITVIDSYLSEQEMADLHTSCDCIVVPSYGESAHIPLIQALQIGKQAIVTDNTGAIESLDCAAEQLHCVPSTREPVLTANPPLHFIYTSCEEWMGISVCSLKQELSKIYRQGQKNLRYNVELIKKHSVDNVADILKKILC